MLTKTKIDYFRERTGPVKHIKYDEVIRYRKHNEPKKKLYEYYVCDYCDQEIKVKDKNCEMTGGIVSIPKTLTKCGNLTLALCNKCLNKVIKEFEDINKHIPRID